MPGYCELCKINVSNFDEHHLERWHNITRDEYLKIYPNSKVYRNYTKKETLKKALKSVENFNIYSYLTIQCKALRKAIYKVHNGKCFYTGELITFENMHIDHLVPKNRDGKDCLANFVPTSSFVNRSKKDKVLDNIEDLIKINETIYAPKVLELLFRDEDFIKTRGKQGRSRYNSNKPISKYTRILNEPQNDMQKEFLHTLESIGLDRDATPTSVRRLEWLTEMYVLWRDTKNT